jgi:hypothetical protein
MDVKEAVGAAEQCIQKLFSEENIESRIGRSRIWARA